MEIVFIETRSEWESVLNRFGGFDVYHTYEYSQLANDGESFFLLHVRLSEEQELLLPITFRNLETTAQGYDASSVYGYPGPLFRGSWDDADIETAWNHVSLQMKERKFVCLVSRLNPFFPAAAKLSAMGEVIPVNSVVGIDLSLPEEDQVSQYRSNHRRDLKKLNKLKVSCRKVDWKAHLDDFIDMYRVTMDRLEATDTYYFSRDYYQSLFTAKTFETQLYLCFDDKQVPVCGGIFFTAGSVMHYHLGATAESFLSIAPTKLLFDTVRKDCSSGGLKVLNLGGGLAGQDDGLFRFKAGFSKCIYQYELLFSKFEPQVYDKLCAERHEAAKAAGGSLKTDFYPEYRAPIVRDGTQSDSL